jgi:hypothetical protein
MSSTPKDDKYLSLENEMKDLEKRFKVCRNEIIKSQKEKFQIEERLSKSLALEETLSELLDNKRTEFNKIKTEKILAKESQKQDIELEKLKQYYEKKLIGKDKEIEKLSESLSSKESLIKQTRDAHALAECPNSGIYLLRLDASDKLKDKFKIPTNIISKNNIIYKYGRSNDVLYRKEQHNQNLGKYIGKELELIHSRLVSHYDCSSSETKVKKFLQEKDCYFISESTDGTKHKELVCINNKLLDEIKSFYNTL